MNHLREKQRQDVSKGRDFAEAASRLLAVVLRQKHRIEMVLCGSVTESDSAFEVQPVDWRHAVETDQRKDLRGQVCAAASHAGRKIELMQETPPRDAHDE